jgi:hypothetical protein
MSAGLGSSQGHPGRVGGLTFRVVERLGAGQYPNPFNPFVAIEFYCAGMNTPVTLEIFDVLGRKVCTVFSGRLDAGATRFTWDGRSDSGTRVSSGVYFCRLTRGTQTLTRKAVHIR